MIKIEEKEQHVVEVFEGVIRRTLACGKDVLMAKFEYKKGSRVPPHSHSYEQRWNCYQQSGDYSENQCKDCNPLISHESTKHVSSGTLSDGLPTVISSQSMVLRI